MLNDWLNRLAKLRVDRASKNPAPHKPLLLLAILDQIEEGSSTSNIVKLTPELAFRFLGYWEVVSSRGRSVGRAELPFFHLQSDGFLRHVAIPGLEAALGSIRPTSVELLNKVISHAEIPEEFFVLMQNTDHRDAARKILIAGNWFSPEEKIKLLAMLGFGSSDFDLDGESMLTVSRDEDVKQGRDINSDFKSFLFITTPARFAGSRCYCHLGLLWSRRHIFTNLQKVRTTILPMVWRYAVIITGHLTKGFGR